jgi:hypothetical protein
MPSVWQKVGGHRQFRHSWRDAVDPTFSAMSIVAVVLILLAVALLAAAVVVVVRRDGYGTLEPPHSHPAWDDAPGAAWPTASHAHRIA